MRSINTWINARKPALFVRERSHKDSRVTACTAFAFVFPEQMRCRLCWSRTESKAWRASCVSSQPQNCDWTVTEWGVKQMVTENCINLQMATILFSFRYLLSSHICKCPDCSCSCDVLFSDVMQLVFFRGSWKLILTRIPLWFSKSSPWISQWAYITFLFLVFFLFFFWIWDTNFWTEMPVR